MFIKHTQGYSISLLYWEVLFIPKSKSVKIVYIFGDRGTMLLNDRYKIIRQLGRGASGIEQLGVGDRSASTSTPKGLLIFGID